MSDKNIRYEIPSGWEDLTRKALVAIMKLAQSKGIYDDFNIIQVKEQYGRLVIYVSHYDKDIEEIIKLYGDMSEKICSECGQKATMMAVGYILPYCTECAKHLNQTVLTFEEFDDYLKQRIEKQNKLWEEYQNGNK